MERALALAREAESGGEVPVGAVLTVGGDRVAEAANQTIALRDPTAHAEILALRAACRQMDNYRLPAGSTLYVTLEPCAMCAGALVNARLDRLVFAARDLRFGAVRSKFHLADHDLLNHRSRVEEGLLGPEATALLQNFFAARR